MEPLVFAILAGLTPPQVETVLYDERIEPVPLAEPTNLVAMTVETYTARRSYQLASHYRRRGVPVVMGGYHPTFLPAEVLRFWRMRKWAGCSVSTISPIILSWTGSSWIDAFFGASVMRRQGWCKAGAVAATHANFAPLTLFMVQIYGSGP
jgi:hypothetical protein